MSELAVDDRLTGLLESLGQPKFEYGVSMARWPAFMRMRFVESGPDSDLVDYLERVRHERASRTRTLAQRVLRLAMSDFDANALLGMYPMHLFGPTQARHLLGANCGGSLLDIGAGSGDVTRALQPLFERVEVVESSWAAQRRLRAAGFVCYGYDVASVGIQGGGYHVISLLNVLDRTDRPMTLLERCRSKMGSDTRLLVSVPLPYRPHVYAGATTREPKERLPIVGNQFSDASLRLVEHVLVPAGFEVMRFTRLPYLSGGDSTRPLTVLDAAVLVLRRS